MRDGLEKCTVQISCTLRNAMHTLSRGAAEIALVIDSNQRLCGTLTDGDIRRALLAGIELDAPLQPHIHTNFVSVSERTGRAEVLDLMKALSINQIPIIDSAGRLVGLHTVRQLLGAVPRQNWAVIMAGGRGTRLRPITESIPKPMVKVAGRPILERIVLHLVGNGITRLFVAVNYLSAIIERHFGTGEQLGCQIEYLREDRPLGTGGALSLLPSVPANPILVMNGDLITQADLGAMLQFHADKRATATVAIRRYFHEIPFGCVSLDGDAITEIEEKPQLSCLINAGIYVLDPEVVSRTPGEKALTMPEIISDCFARKEKVLGYEIDGDWMDVGQPEQLQAARGEQ